MIKDDKITSTAGTNTTSLYLLQKSADVMSILRAPFRRKSAPPLTPKLNCRSPSLHTHPDSLGSSAVINLNDDLVEEPSDAEQSDNNNDADDYCVNLNNYKTNIYVDIETSTNSLTGLDLIFNNSNNINNFNNNNNMADISTSENFKNNNEAASVSLVASTATAQDEDDENDDNDILPAYGNDFNNSKNNLLQIDDCSLTKSSIDCHLDNIDKLNEKLDKNLMVFMKSTDVEHTAKLQITSSTKIEKKNSFREKLKIKMKKNSNLEGKLKSKVFNLSKQESADDHLLSTSPGEPESILPELQDETSKRQKKKKKKKKRTTNEEKSFESEEELLNNDDVNGNQILLKTTNVTTTSSSSFSNQLLQTLKSFNLKNSSSSNNSKSAEAEATDIILKNINDDIEKNSIVLLAAQAASNDDAKTLTNIQFLFDDLSTTAMTPDFSNPVLITPVNETHVGENTDVEIIEDHVQSSLHATRQITDLDDSNQGSIPSSSSNLNLDIVETGIVIGNTKSSNFGSKLKQNIKSKFKLHFKGINKNASISSSSNKLCKKCSKRSRIKRHPTSESEQTSSGTPIHTSKSVFDFAKEYHLNFTENSIKEFCNCDYDDEDDDEFLSIKNHHFVCKNSGNGGGVVSIFYVFYISLSTCMLDSNFIYLCFGVINNN